MWTFNNKHTRRIIEILCKSPTYDTENLLLLEDTFSMFGRFDAGYRLSD